MLYVPAPAAHLTAASRPPAPGRTAPPPLTARSAAALLPHLRPRMRAVVCTASGTSDAGVARLLALGADAREAASVAPLLTSLLSSANTNYYDTVAGRVLRFCRVLGVSASNAFRFSSTQPALYALGEAELAARADALRAVLPPGTRLGEVVGRAPTLLLAPAGDVAAACADVAFLHPALLAPLLEVEPTLLQPTRGPRVAEVRAVWQAGPFAALPVTHVPADEAEEATLRRYAQDVLSSPYH